MADVGLQGLSSLGFTALALGPWLIGACRVRGT